MKSLCCNLVVIVFLACCGSTSRADLLINEIMADPGGFDSNNDGDFNTTQDEYIELVNNMTTSLDISGYKVKDSTTTRHVFAASTILAPGQALVLFGGGTPDGTFGGSVVAIASGLGLNNGGDKVSVTDDSDNELATHEYGSEGGNDTSLTRDPDLTGNFVQHNSTAGGLTGSPGLRIDGTTFSTIPEPSSFAFLAVAVGAIVLGKHAFGRRQQT